MEEKKVIKVIQAALKIDKGAIKNIQATEAGMTNDSFFAEISGEDFIVRLPGKGSEALINRSEEEQSLKFATALGINPETIYFNGETGVKITRKVNGAKMLTAEKARTGKTMKQLIELFQCLHRADGKLPHTFDPFMTMAKYEALIEKEGVEIHQKIEMVKEDVYFLKSLYEEIPVGQVACHIDAACSNIILDKSEDIHLIDWEYSGNYDPLWDLATLFQSLALSLEEEHFFLTHYFEREPTEEELKRLLLHKVFMNYMWTYWYFYKEIKGERFEANFSDSWRIRLDLTKKYIQAYKEQYLENIVV